jgi:uncharacterized protein YciW
MPDPVELVSKQGEEMTRTIAPATDTVDAILGNAAGGAVAELRGEKPELREQLEAYYRSIFAPGEHSAAALSVQDRALVAARVASHTGSTAVVEWYRALATEHGASAELTNRVIEGGSVSTGSGPRDAALKHADLLTTAPADATAEDLKKLKAAGLTPGAILALSQTIAFVSYQLRLIAGFRAIGELR